jgi:tetratricopeptide (TPR) repeat protein
LKSDLISEAAYSYIGSLALFLFNKQESIQTAMRLINHFPAHNQLLAFFSGLMLLCSSLASAVPILSTEHIIQVEASSILANEKEWQFYRQGQKDKTNNEFAEAKISFQASLKENPKFFPALLGLADIELSRKNLNAAKKHIQEALISAPKSSAATNAWAKYLYLTGQNQKAADTFLKAIALNPDYLEPKVELASLYLLRLNAPDKSIALYQDALKASKQSNVQLFFGLSSSYMTLKQFDLAEKTLFDARQLFPDNFQIYELLASLYSIQGDIIHAISNYQHSIKLNPTRFTNRRNLTDLYMSQGQLDNVINLLEQLPNELSSNFELNYKLALAYQLQKKHTKAKKVYLSLLSADPKNPAVLNNLATLLLEESPEKNLSQALKYSLKANLLAKNNANYLDTLGLTYLKQGALQKAKDTLEKALKIDPDLSAAQEHLALIN